MLKHCNKSVVELGVLNEGWIDGTKFVGVVGCQGALWRLRAAAVSARPVALARARLRAPAATPILDRSEVSGPLDNQCPNIL